MEEVLLQNIQAERFVEKGAWRFSNWGRNIL